MKQNPILARPKHTARIGMTPKNMSHNLKFTSSVGHLLPVYYDFLNPGEKVRISDNLFSRTQPLHTSALVSLTEHVEYFFVPAHLLNSKFTDFITGVHATPYTTIMNGIDADGGQLLGMSVTPQIAQFFDMPHGRDNKSREPLIYSQDRLLQHLGYGKDFFYNIANAKLFEEDATVYVNCLRLQAYQKICQDYFWRDDWDEHNMRAFNNDFGEYSSNNDLLALTELHCCPWKKDYFTIVMPQPLFNQNAVNAFSGNVRDAKNQFLISPFVNGVSSDDIDVISQDSGATPFQSDILNFSYVGSSDNLLPATSTSKNVYAVAPFNTQANSSTASLRLNLAIEKLYQITNFAKKDYVSQIAAHFGYKANSYLSYRSIKIASHSIPLQINPVVATAETDGANLGQLAGYGVASGVGKKVDFTAPCHGIFMAIYYCCPEADYQNLGIDSFNFKKNRIDFYTPELDNLGVVPMNPIEGNMTADPMSWNGFTFRYLEDKLRYNKIITGFNTEQLSHWVISRSDITTIQNYRDLYVQPDYLDPIMLSVYWPSWNGLPDEGNPAWTNYETDPLLHVIRFEILKLSTHSTFGLPKL